MRLPDDLRAAIEQEIAKVDRRTLGRAVTELIQSYKSGAVSAPAMRSEGHRAAYLVTRLPATYAACRRALEEIRRLAPQAPITTMLDLGAGPGTALWAAPEIFPDLAHATLIESDDALVKVGKRLAADAPYRVLRDAQWKAG